MDKPFISIIIPTHNSASTLAEGIKGCLNQDYPRDRLEIIVVDDGSKDDTKKVVESFPVKYIYQKKAGPASARNNGWRNSKGHGLCFIDADCIPYTNWVSKLARHCDRGDIDAVAGSYAVDGCRYLLDKFVHYEIKYRHSKMPEYTNSFGTYNVLVKRHVFEALGGFDSGYCNASGEDSDLAYRIIKAGHKIYFEKQALVSHHNSLRILKYFAVQFRHSYWRMKLYRKSTSMITRDEYGYWKDFAELFLVAGLAVCLSLNSFTLSALLAALLFVMQMPLSIKIFLAERDARYLIFSFVTFVRAFVRILGGILGFIAFWIIKR